ncbi:MAG: hypothetical protein ACXACX_22765, partial [Candidatus Hodarchaeales archaeon]
MNLKKFAPIIALVIIGIITVALVIVFLPPVQISTPGSKKAIILGSANDFFRKDGEPDFNGGPDATFTLEPTGFNWMGNFSENTTGWRDENGIGYNSMGWLALGVNGSGGYVNMEWAYNWTDFHTLLNYAAYNFSARINVTDNGWNPTLISIPPGAGARIGLRWLNSSNGIVRTDWSVGILGNVPGWNFLNVTGIANSSTPNEITQLHLVLAVEGIMVPFGMVLFDDLNIEYWFPPPIPIPIPGNIDTDGFPAQALQVYWILKNHGYTDDNIFLMLYHTGDSVIDINASDGIL